MVRVPSAAATEALKAVVGVARPVVHAGKQVRVDLGKGSRKCHAAIVAALAPVAVKDR